MRSKLLVLSIVAAIGIVGCSKEEETTTVSPVTAPAVTGTQTAPDQGATAPQAQENVQSQEQLPASNVAPQPQVSTEQASPVVTVTNDTSNQVQPTSAQAQSAPNPTASAPNQQNASSNASVEQGQVVPVTDNLTPPTTPTTNQAPEAQVNTASPVVVEQPKQ